MEGKYEEEQKTENGQRERERIRARGIRRGILKIVYGR